MRPRPSEPGLYRLTAAALADQGRTRRELLRETARPFAEEPDAHALGTLVALSGGTLAVADSGNNCLMLWQLEQAPRGRRREEHAVMCPAIPGRVREIYKAGGARIGRVDVGGIVKDVCLAYLPDIQVGDCTVEHVGFAIQRLDEASALQTLEVFRPMGRLEEEPGGGEERGGPS